MITHAEEINLKLYAMSNLTEVLGYTAEEAAQFVFDKTDEGKIVFWHPDHPDWVYTLYIDKRTGEMVVTTPFDTGYELFRGENAIRGLLQAIREKGYFENWNSDNHQELISLLNTYEIWISTELYFADDGGKAVHGFFESCYGPDFAWPEQLCQVYQSILEEYHLTREQEPLHQLGIRKSVHPQTIGAVRTVILFEGEIPDELKSVLNNSHLNGWQCSSGAVILQDWSQCTTLNSKKKTGCGLVAFEKDCHRQLVHLYLEDDGWKIIPLGENALLQTGDYRVTFDGIHNSIAVEYVQDENEMVSFYLTPAVSGKSCTIAAYERLYQSNGEAVWISCAYSLMPTWKSERMEDGQLVSLTGRMDDQCVITFRTERVSTRNSRYLVLCLDHLKEKWSRKYQVSPGIVCPGDGYLYCLESVNDSRTSPARIVRLDDKGNDTVSRILSADKLVLGFNLKVSPMTGNLMLYGYAVANSKKIYTVFRMELDENMNQASLDVRQIDYYGDYSPAVLMQKDGTLFVHCNGGEEADLLMNVPTILIPFDMLPVTETYGLQLK